MVPFRAWSELHSKDGSLISGNTDVLPSVGNVPELLKVVIHRTYAVWFFLNWLESAKLVHPFLSRSQEKV